MSFATLGISHTLVRRGPLSPRFRLGYLKTLGADFEWEPFAREGGDLGVDLVTSENERVALTGSGWDRLEVCV
jgi:hypothetical protein